MLHKEIELPQFYELARVWLSFESEEMNAILIEIIGNKSFSDGLERLYYKPLEEEFNIDLEIEK